MHTVAVLVGSLRRDSINRKLARALAKLAAAAAQLEFRFIELGNLPLYNDDLWQDPPAAVMKFKADVAACDAVLMVTPEYNRGLPAVIKNAFDWGTRPSKQNVWAGKPAATAGAAGGSIGTAVAQSQLRHSMTVLGMFVMGQPELYFQFKSGVITEEGDIADEAVRTLLAAWVDAFSRWIKRFAP
jgi:chromate reductase